MLQVKVKQLHPDAVFPKFLTDATSSFDLCAINSGRIDPPAVTTIGTGLALEIPKGYAMFLVANSKNAFKHGVSIAQGFAIINSDYREEITLALTSSYPFKFFTGDKLAHGIILPIPAIELIKVEELTPTERPLIGFADKGQPFHFG